MAELNFGLLNPPGSQSIGNAFVQGMDQAAAARAQENQNALSQYTLSKARREDQVKSQLLNELRSAKTPEEQQQAYINAGMGKEALEMKGIGLRNTETQGKIDLQPGAKEKQLGELRNKNILEVAGLPSFESANAAIDTRLANKSITQAMAEELRLGLTQENFEKWKHNTLIRLLTPEQQLIQSAVKTKDTDRGGYIERQTYNAQGIAVGDPIMLPKTAAPSTDAAMLSASVRFNPETGAFQNVAPAGMSMRQPPGTSINTMVTPSAAPNTQMITQPRAPAAVIPATGTTTKYSPRMAREIEMDRLKSLTPKYEASAGGFVYPPSAENPQGKFVAVAGIDGKPLTESQGNATAFGLRMKESEAILADLANPKTGDATLRGANVESIPFVGGAVGKVLPSFLGGSNEQQQQVVQAKTNFITAVLRKESGAAIGQDEFTTEDRKYFPQLNDGPKVIKQKENARRLAIEAMKFQAGPGAKEIDKYVPSVSPSAPPIQSFRRR